MSQRLDAAALQDGSAVLRRLARLVEEGTLEAGGDSQLIVAASWWGAADGLTLAADALGDH